jgi:hypothetical protein
VLSFYRILSACTGTASCGSRNASTTPGGEQLDRAKESIGFSKYATNLKHYINQQARRDRFDRIGLTGLYPNHPDILVQHPCALSDDNNGATLIRAGVMRTHFPSNLQIGEADGDAPV